MSEATRDMQITERELTTMTRDLDEMHHASLRGFHEALARYSETIQATLSRIGDLVHRDATRRNFLRGGLVTAGAVGGGAVLAACGTSSGTQSSGTASAVTGARADLEIARLSASIEVLAVGAYATALKVAVSGALGTVPPALAAFVTTAKEQHTEHQLGWNGLLTKNGEASQTAPDPALDATVQAGLKAVKGIPDLATLALELETIALQTYVNGSALMQSADARLLALTIAPVEAQHAAILNFVLGQYPSADTEIPKDKARTPDDLKASVASATVKQP